MTSFWTFADAHPWFVTLWIFFVCAAIPTIKVTKKYGESKP